MGSIWNAAGPDPDSETFCGLPVAESEKDSVAERGPLAVGLNTTLAEQLAEAARLDPHVLLLMAKSPELAPPRVTPLIVTDDLVPFVNVADCAELVEPTAVLGKPIAVGETVTLPLAELPPVPESATVCGLLLDVSDTVRVAARDPLTLGLKATEMLQLADAARLVPQVLLEMRKSPGFVPAMATLLIVMDEVDPFFSVAVWVVLVDPTVTEPYESEVGLMVTVPPEPVPVPDNAAVCGVFVAESLKLSVAVRVPLTVGAKMILAEQLADAARLVPQVLLLIR
jgi:hypothetical protein